MITLKIRARDIGKSQAAALRKMVKYAHQQMGGDRVPHSVRWTLAKTEYGTVWVLVMARRDDCSEFSQRRVFTEVRLYAEVGTRGGINWYTAKTGTLDNTNIASIIVGGTDKGSKTTENFRGCRKLRRSHP